MKKSLLTLVVVLIALTCYAQTYKLSGTIKDSNGQPVPFTSVYIKGTTTGTSANIDGFYSFSVSSGAATIVYRALGYSPAEQYFDISGDVRQDITLREEAYTLRNITITPGGEDPAMDIMRKAIRNRGIHLNEVKAYTADVYIKGVQKLVGAPKRFFGRDIQKTLDLDTNRHGILYLSESTSRFAYQHPGKIREEMVSSKVAGRNNAFSFNKASDLVINFYENIQLENVLSTRGFISPLADNALRYYRYRLVGTTTEDDNTIYKIELLPRRNYDPVFRGHIYIVDNTYHLTSAHVYLTENTGINLLDTLNISQQFLRTDQTYMPSNVHFQFYGDVFGFKFAGYYIGVYSNYNLHPEFPEGYFNGEILKVNKAVNKKDSLFWLNNRPIPLTAEERRDYRRKDSLEALKVSRHYLDSLEKANNQFGAIKFIVSGYTINNRYEKKSYSFDPFYRSFLYNTVEGFALKPALTYTRQLDDRKYYSIRPELRYGFSNKLLTGNLSANYYYDPTKLAGISVSGGSGIYDLNNLGSMSLFANTFNTLFFETNFSKFYKKEFVNISTSRELSNGLLADLKMDYSWNTWLRNTSSFKIRDLKDEQFTSNNPFSPATETPLFPTYRALTLSASLTYTIGQTYITRPDGKFYQPSKYPVLKLSYRKGINHMLGSDVDYDLLSFEASETRISTGMLGYSSFVAGIGKFFNRNQIYYPEAQHFRGNNSFLSKPDIRRFLFLDFYLYGTDREYAEFHYEHNFSGLLTNKVPILRKLKLEEVIGASYLTQPVKRNYTEFYFGLQRLIFRAAYGFAYDGNKRVQHGFRLTYNL
ncbi:DUF5686 and carboxypeptidase regulatory-like domain-containing protein [Pedobacter sp. JY14-1]|uniref:DUF5686 and carboxypeptidase regulatory-like domain-containing protein n=1 Tax=Pedobacter sp. JY14-1 TaxID=3034151 RepID=UPI0023E2FB94|nr:DUF5686 and carboxypeptidase regulatory-like domain-containing protein [Pedobacter sp. JY14-1]